MKHGLTVTSYNLMISSFSLSITLLLPVHDLGGGFCATSLILYHLHRARQLVGAYYCVSGASYAIASLCRSRARSLSSELVWLIPSARCDVYQSW